jgi:hypothetical protein
LQSSYRLSLLACVASRWHVDCYGSDAGDCRAQFETGRRRDGVFRARRRIFLGLSAGQSTAVARRPRPGALPMQSTAALHAGSGSVAKFRTDCPKSGTGKFTGKSEVSDCNAFKVFIAWQSPTLSVATASNARSKVSSHSFLVLVGSSQAVHPSARGVHLPDHCCTKRDRADAVTQRTAAKLPPSTSERACVRASDMATTSAGVVSNAAAFAARSSGVPFFDRRGLREWTRRQAS